MSREARSSRKTTCHASRFSRPSSRRLQPAPLDVPMNFFRKSRKQNAQPYSRFQKEYSSLSGGSFKKWLLQIDLPPTLPVHMPHLKPPPVAHFSSLPFFFQFKYTQTSQAIQISPEVPQNSSASTFATISIFHTLQHRYQTSGNDGISPSPPGFVTISTFHWAAIASPNRSGSATSLLSSS